MALIDMSPMTTTAHGIQPHTQSAGQLATMPDLLTLDDLKRVLRVGTSTLFRWRRQGLLPPEAFLPGRPKWHRADIAKWLEERRD